VGGLAPALLDKHLNAMQDSDQLSMPELVEEPEIVLKLGH
jgi:hypothetical protein